jgi:GT2 family glycosyltransferase
VRTGLNAHPRSLPDDRLPSIAIGILNFNRAAEVVTTLSILTAIDYPPDKCRLIVIDNASSDGTDRIVAERFGDRVEMLPLPENIGAVARNRVMMTRPEEYIFVFDEDCAPEDPATIRRVVELMEANPYFGAFCFRSINLYSGLTEYGDFGEISRRRIPGGHEGVFVVGNGMCFRRDAIQRTSGYDERIFWGAEEFELAMELLREGVPILYENDLALIHRRAPRVLPPADALAIDTRNNIWISFKYFPIPLAVLFSVGQIVRRAAAAIVKRKPGGLQAIYLGAREGVRELSTMIARRKPIPVSLFARHNRWFFQIIGNRRSRIIPTTDRNRRNLAAHAEYAEITRRSFEEMRKETAGS